MAGRPEKLRSDRAVRICQLGRVARHRPGAAVPRRAERGLIRILRRARRTADDRADLPPRGRSSWRAADGSVGRGRVAAAVFVRCLRRWTAADSRNRQEGRRLRGDRSHAAGVPHSRRRAGMDRAGAHACLRFRRARMAGGRCPRHVRHRSPGARRDRRKCRRRTLDHRSQRGAEEGNGEHVDGGSGDPVVDARAWAGSSRAARDRRGLGRAAADCVRQCCSAAAGSWCAQEARGRCEIRARSTAPADRSATVLRIDRAIPDRGRPGCWSRVRELRCHRIARSR